MAKRRTTSPVDLEEEMSKCGLVKKQKQGRAVLRGLMYMWQGQVQQLVDHEKIQPSSSQQQQQQQRKSDRNPQLSEAFPENLLCLENPIDQCQYATVGKGGKHIVFGKNNDSLPSLDLNGPTTTPITFLLSTNVDMVKLKLLNKNAIAIRQENLDNDLCIDAETIEDVVDREAWETFVEKKVPEVSK